MKTDGESLSIEYTEKSAEQIITALDVLKQLI